MTEDKTGTCESVQVLTQKMWKAVLSFMSGSQTLGHQDLWPSVLANMPLMNFHHNRLNLRNLVTRIHLKFLIGAGQKESTSYDVTNITRSWTDNIFNISKKHLPFIDQNVQKKFYFIDMVPSPAFLQLSGLYKGMLMLRFFPFVFFFKWMHQCGCVVCLFVCVCVRERERERARA